MRLFVQAVNVDHASLLEALSFGMTDYELESLRVQFDPQNLVASPLERSLT